MSNLAKALGLRNAWREIYRREKLTAEGRMDVERIFPLLETEAKTHEPTRLWGAHLRLDGVEMDEKADHTALFATFGEGDKASAVVAFYDAKSGGITAFTDAGSDAPPWLEGYLADKLEA